tara:strand:+ start:127 stop:513 length:387 start_codon:yes stop_codon:yes gene_type:complete
MQTAKLKLPVKQFHQLHDLLGDILDHEAETNDFNMENSDIELMEDIRTELFMQIPDEEPIETTYAFTAVSGATNITPVKLYEVTNRDAGGGFLITNDAGREIYCIEKGCSHLSHFGSKNWKLFTTTND